MYCIESCRAVLELFYAYLCCSVNEVLCDKKILRRARGRGIEERGNVSAVLVSHIRDNDNSRLIRLKVAVVFTFSYSIHFRCYLCYLYLIVSSDSKREFHPGILKL